ncbi:hypothetical protein KI387_011418, partial [Taxus chinensis]
DPCYYSSNVILESRSSPSSQDLLHQSPPQSLPSLKIRVTQSPSSQTFESTHASQSTDFGLNPTSLQMIYHHIGRSTPPSSTPETSSSTSSSSPTSSSSINHHQTSSKSSTPIEPLSSNQPLVVDQQLIPIDLFQNEEKIRAFIGAHEDIPLEYYEQGFSLDFNAPTYCEEKVDSFYQEIEEEPQIMQLDPPLILPSSHSSLREETPRSCIDPWPIFSSPNHSLSIIIPQSKSLMGSTPSSPSSSS